MAETKLNGKTIITQSLGKYIFLTCLSYLFTIGLSVTYATSDEKWINIMGILLFGTGAIMQSYKLYSPKYSFMKAGSPEWDKSVQEDFEARQKDIGAFTYTDDNITIQFKKELKQFTWGQIETLTGYKLDNRTTDTIAMELHLSNNDNFRITEDLPGWYQFQNRLKERQFVPQDWDAKIAFPAFAQNFTLLYDRQNRTLEEIFPPKK